MWPAKISASVPQTPARSTSTITWPLMGTGRSTSRTSATHGAVTTNARILIAAARPSGADRMCWCTAVRRRRSDVGPAPQAVRYMTTRLPCHVADGRDMSDLRSAQWYAGEDRNSYIHRAWMRRGIADDAFADRPHIAIANSASDLTPCNSHLNEIAESVKQGVWAAGGVPLNLPVVSLGETQVRPTAMLWRNMAAMATEEMLRANPIDGVVLLGGCDKTIPALLMAAASVDLPAVVVPGGPMLTGTFRGAPLGCGTDVWRLSEEVRAGTLSDVDFMRSEASMIRSPGHCNTMGTASTMGLLAEVLGMTLPGTAGLPAPDSRLLAQAHETGRLVVEMVAQERRPSTLMSAGSFHNAIVALAALGGSTN